MRIRCKLTIGYFIVALLTGVVGYLGMHIVSIVKDEFKREAETEVPLNEALQELRYAGLRIVSSSMEYAFLKLHKGLGHAEDTQTEKELIQGGINRYRAALKNYQSIVRGKPGHDVVAKIEKLGDGLIQTSAAIITAIDNKALGPEIHELKERNEEVENQFLQIIDQQLDFDARAFAKGKADTYATIRGAQSSIMTTTAATFALALLSGIIISARISRRLARLELAAEKIGNGELDTPIEPGANDEIGTLARAFSRMASDLARTSNEIRNSKDFLNEVINAMMDGLIVLGHDGTIQSTNREGQALLGYEDEPIGVPMSQVIRDFTLDELTKRGFVRDEEKTVSTRDGRLIPVTFSASVMWNMDHSIRCIVCVVQDITKRKQAEAELQRFFEELQTSNDELKQTEIRLKRYSHFLKESNDELKNFAYIISHDLRAPLVNIKGFAGELKGCIQELNRLQAKVFSSYEANDADQVREILDVDVPEALAFINSSVSRMDTMVNLVLTLSRIGHRELRPELIDLNELVDDMLKRLMPKLEEKNVQVTVKPLPVVIQDKDAMEQIIGNLLDNAVKYLDASRPGRIEIWVEGRDDEYVFHFSDNGRGILMEELNKVFEIFRRAGKQDVAGEGMGLAYVKATIRRLGGNIWCASEFGVGSTFSFSLPVDGKGIL